MTTARYRLSIMIRSWPRAVSFLLCVPPLLALAFLVGNLVFESELALTRLGLAHLFSFDYEGIFGSGGYQFGLLPAMWGTLLVLVMACGLAVPVALCMALLSAELRLGPLSRSIRWVLGVLSGVPPIVYGLLAGVVTVQFVRPKFCAWGIPTAELPPEGMTWWSPGMLPNSLSLFVGGLLLALFIIPFMAPLMDDALRGVPAELREASIALGATHWHTVTRVVIPGAVAGLVSAVSMGALKAIGDLAIVSLAVGYSPEIPVPAWDIFESAAPLTSTSAGLLGAFSEGDPVGFSRSVGYFIGLLLLVIAATTMVLVDSLRRRWQGRGAR